MPNSTKPKTSKAEARREAYKGFSAKFEKTVKSKWFHDMHEAMNGPRVGNSKNGILKMVKVRGLK